MNLEVRVPKREEPKKKKTRIKPAGWLTIVVVSVFVLSLLGLAAQRVFWATRGIEALPTSAPMPTWTPTPTRTPTPTPVPPTPTPEGWSRAWDPVTKQEYLVPPPEVEQQIREAFNAVMAFNAVPDGPDENFRNYDLDRLIEELSGYTVPAIAEMFRQKRGLEIRDFAPETPVRCSDYETCTVSQATLEIKGAIVDHGPSTEIVRAGYRSLAPHGMAFLARVQFWEGKWIVTYWQAEPLPEPPSSP